MVPLTTSVRLSHAVEAWLSQLSLAMVAALQDQLARCVAAGKGADPALFPSQVLCISEQVQFTANVETALPRNALPPLLKQLQVGATRQPEPLTHRPNWLRTPPWTAMAVACWSLRSRR